MTKGPHKKKEYKDNLKGKSGFCYSKKRSLKVTYSVITIVLGSI